MSKQQKKYKRAVEKHYKLSAKLDSMYYVSRSPFGSFEDLKQAKKYNSYSRKIIKALEIMFKYDKDPCTYEEMLDYGINMIEMSAEDEYRFYCEGEYDWGTEDGVYRFFFLLTI